MLHICFLIYPLSQEQISSEQIALIAYVIFFTLAISFVFVMFFIAFQKRKNEMLLDKIAQQKAFDEELLKTQQEIQEETLNHVGRELHDNVGQLLAYASMQLNSVAKNASEDLKPKAMEASNALKDGLLEVRQLSKSLNSDVIFNLGFDKILANEIERLNKLSEFNASLHIEGKIKGFENKKDEIILFRILQEFFSNTLKYAEALHLNVDLIYTEDSLKIIAKDDGKGFDINHVSKGSGLMNMKKRSEMIEANFNIDSIPNEGTVLTLDYPFKLKK